MLFERCVPAGTVNLGIVEYFHEQQKPLSDCENVQTNLGCGSLKMPRRFFEYSAVWKSLSFLICFLRQIT